MPSIPAIIDGLQNIREHTDEFVLKFMSLLAKNAAVAVDIVAMIGLTFTGKCRSLAQLS